MQQMLNNTWEWLLEKVATFTFGYIKGRSDVKDSIDKETNKLINNIRNMPSGRKLSKASKSKR